jgi:hypothetical protein
MTSVIFVTLKDGFYADRWTSELLPVATTPDRAGIRELTWEGQKSGMRDHLVKPNTLVAVRPSKDVRYFEIVGSVILKECSRPRDATHPAEYKLLVEMLRHPKKIYKQSHDRFTHNAVLRAIGIPLEQGAMPHGIYE